jgi:hypothetical protein
LGEPFAVVAGALIAAVLARACAADVANAGVDGEAFEPTRHVVEDAEDADAEMLSAAERASEAPHGISTSSPSGA